MLSPETKRQIRSLAEDGYSHRAIAKQLGIDRGSVGRVLASAPPAPATPPAPPAEPPPAEPPPVAEPEEDLLAEVRSLMGELRNEARSCALAGDVANGAKFARVSASLAPLVFRLERARGQEDGVFIPASELAAKQAQLVAHLRALAPGPFLCSRCGKAERVSWAEDGDRDPPSR